ncbi:MAG: hypothetical protein KJO98_07805 [Rhodothermia bacterium]|nr:hypothetical protein [Rhodothermia bacterium]
MFDSAAVGLPMMLFTFLGIVVAVPTSVYAMVNRQHDVLRKLGMACALWFGIYLVFLLLASLTSRDRTLPTGERLTFCGFYLDCHVGARVSDVRSAKTVTTSSGTFTAAQTYQIVQVTYDSDAVNATLRLHRPPSVRAVWNDGAIRPDREVTAAVRQDVGEAARPVGDLAPSAGVIHATYVFDTAVPANSLKLAVRTGNRLHRLVELFLIGDADSILHGKAYLALG